MSKTGLGDEHSFMVQPWVQQLLQAQFGPHTIDRFASRNNVQVVPPRYNSRFFEPEAEWLNSFSCHWDRGPNQIRENNWIHPPYAIMGRTLSHLITCGAQGTIILPHWEVAPWSQHGGQISPNYYLPTNALLWATDGRQVVILSVSLACNLFFSYYTFGVTFYVFKNCFNIKCTIIHRPA
jgi:hypothetical protein